MMVKFLLFAVFGAAFFVSNCSAALSDVESLEEEFKSRLERVNNLAEQVKNTSITYDEMTKERINTINYLYSSIKEGIKSENYKAVNEGIKRKRWFINFECLANAEKTAESNLEKAYGTYPKDVKTLTVKNVDAAVTFRVFSDNFQAYLKNFYENKKKEISRTSDPATVKKILQEVKEKMQVVDKIQVELENTIFKLKFNFFDNFVKLSYSKETALNEILTKYVPKLLKCMV